MANLSEHYNKKITLSPFQSQLFDPESKFKIDLCYLTYYGKLTLIIDSFNKIKISDAKNLVSSLVTEEKKRNSLQIASFLNFPNIFLYLLTYDADPYYVDENNQNSWHFICYRGHSKILNILLNYILYKIKMKYLESVDQKKSTFGFSNLDISKGKLSRAVHITEVVTRNFNELQQTLKNECEKMIKEFFVELKKGLYIKDKDGQTPLHLAAMSKFPLCHKVINEILDFNFFKGQDESFNDFLNLFFELQSLEIKKERMNEDPRRIFRLERELKTLLGDNIIKDLEITYKKAKKNFFKVIINLPDNFGDTILHISSFCGDYRIVNKLIFYGGNKKKKNDNSKIPVDLAKDNFVRKVLTNLNKAAKVSDQKNITELVNFGENLNEKISIFNQAPIHKIIESKKKNKHDVLKKILEMGSDPNIRDSNGWCPLHYACNYGDFESVKILLDYKANIDNYSNNRRIPLHIASNNNFPQIVEYLCQKKSDLNSKDDLGCTPLHLAAKNGNTKCLEILLFYGADLYSIDFRGWNILHYSAFHGHKYTVRFICKYDADYDKLKNTKNTQNKLPIEIVRDPEVKKYFYSLWHAAKEGNLDLTMNLLNEGENINEQTHFEKNTPIMLAVLNAHFLEVRLLYENGADTELKNKNDVFAKEYANLLVDPLNLKFKNCKDLDREKMDLRNIIRSLVKKPEEFINATVCKNNWDIRVWFVHDFVIKIDNLLNGKSKDEELETNRKKKLNEQSNKPKNVYQKIIKDTTILVNKDLKKKNSNQNDIYDNNNNINNNMDNNINNNMDNNTNNNVNNGIYNNNNESNQNNLIILDNKNNNSNNENINTNLTENNNQIENNKKDDNNDEDEYNDFEKDEEPKNNDNNVNKQNNENNEIVNNNEIKEETIEEEKIEDIKEEEKKEEEKIEEKIEEEEKEDKINGKNIEKKIVDSKAKTEYTSVENK